MLLLRFQFRFQLLQSSTLLLQSAELVDQGCILWFAFNRVEEKVSNLRIYFNSDLVNGLFRPVPSMATLRVQWHTQ